MSALIDGYADWSDDSGNPGNAPPGWAKTLDIVLTNGCSSNSWKILDARATHYGITLRVFFMLR
jgi:hypothetical protein